ncbi:nucleotidyl transferase AbiEii/AbiGii toxin family protein [Streptomyces bambusae]|uniref:nucleotidyl transferase AbiEii/AbiGii toxin family protein n=1 Tax=Streptomyces bambusae TaxID=1550616 RepID=UPI001CFE1669|nr:nucleotidyl transferase AbiEii/AbiGii toxin family protein [Streptomyces bambusae]MCB5164843.1 nucleotidyl transferase AbiEii/AbiGii toxin family protein [Streptomyces bambusae]
MSTAADGAGTWERFSTWSTEVPRAPLSDETREERDLPHTLRPVAGEDLVQVPLFDPALKHFSNGYRAGDPVFEDPARTDAWRRARRAGLDTVLAAVADSPWVDSLVLRGSVLLAGWFGEAAREPGDLDFVVVPHTWRLEDGRTGRMLDGIARGAQERAGAAGLRIRAQDAVTDEIWTYDRVPGRRMVLPWEADGLPGGHVQLDFVFNERLPQPPGPVHVPGLAGGDGAVLQAATPELSLAWKLMWLLTDRHPQGKDLYDAVLLAERHPAPRELVTALCRESGEWGPDEVRLGHFERLVEEIRWEWRHTEREYPALAGREELGGRLLAALAPVFRA